MSIEIAPDLEEMVQSILKGGQYDGESAVLREALSLLRQRDQLRRDIHEGIDDLDSGERIPAEEVFRELEMIGVRGPCGSS
jgi:antitoxin ParD1/3/4